MASRGHGLLCNLRLWGPTGHGPWQVGFAATALLATQLLGTVTSATAACPVNWPVRSPKV